MSQGIGKVYDTLVKIYHILYKGLLHNRAQGSVKVSSNSLGTLLYYRKAPMSN